MMGYAGIPTAEEMHISSEQETVRVVEDYRTLYSYVIDTMQHFKGRNALPRVIEHVLTREYLLFDCREGHPDDALEIATVAEQFKKAGYFCDLRDTEELRRTHSSSLIVCWDPSVISADEAAHKLSGEDYQKYLEILRYVRAEQALPDVAREAKDELLVDGCYTRDWVSIPIISKQMYTSAFRAATLLWNQGYYIGFRVDTRRMETWTLFVVWDTEIVRDMGDKPSDLVFRGEVPSTWR